MSEQSSGCERRAWREEGKQDELPTVSVPTIYYHQEARPITVQHCMYNPSYS